MSRIIGSDLIKDDKTLQAWLARRVKGAEADGSPIGKTRRLYDGSGFFLLDQVGKAPGWRLEYKAWSAQKGRMASNMVSLGTYPKVSLAVAREKVPALRDQVARGDDPAKARAAAQASAKAQDTNARENMARAACGLAPVGSFMDVAQAVHDKRLASGKWQERYAREYMRVIKSNMGALHERALSSITEEDLKACVDPYIAAGKLNTAAYMLEYADAIFVEGRLLGRCKHNIAADLKGYVIRPAPKSHPAIKNQSRIGELVRALRASDATVTAAACMLQLMLFQRSTNTVGMKWADIDWTARVWRIGSGEMKMRAAQKKVIECHSVPLPKQALQLLWNLRSVTGQHKHVFMMRADGVDAGIARGTMLKHFRALGFMPEEMNAHGLRGTAFSAIESHIDEDFTKEVEANLAHVYGGPQGATYNKAEYIEKRRPALQAWADHLDALADGTWEKAQQEKAEAALEALRVEFGAAPAFLKAA